MPRPLFEIAREVSADWKNPSPQAKTYLKGMYYLLGMDDLVADLNAATAVRMFLLYSKEWLGPVAERIKAELQIMRRTHLPKNADLFSTEQFAACDLSIECCDLCEATLGIPPKFIKAYTHWNACKRMCMHCALFLSAGVDVGDGAVFMANTEGAWLHLHGEPKMVDSNNLAAPRDHSKVSPRDALKPKFRHRLRLFGRKVAKKCASLVRGWFRRSA
jgi:hypothetical protein